MATSRGPRVAGIGLLRTGTGSLAREFASSMATHELGMPILRPAALDRADGLIDDAEFLRRTRFRLGEGAAAVDISTVHHLYADLLIEIWPTSTFIITMRDVRSWVNSVLGLIQRKNAYVQGSGASLTTADARYQVHLAGVDGRPYAMPDDDLVASLMRYWADHHHRLARILPECRVERCCLIGHSEIREHRSPLPQPDRFMMGDRAAKQISYLDLCAGLMVEYFPREHADLMRAWETCEEPDWAGHVHSMNRWLNPLIAQGRPPSGASPEGWT